MGRRAQLAGVTGCLLAAFVLASAVSAAEAAQPRVTAVKAGGSIGPVRLGKVTITIAASKATSKSKVTLALSKDNRLGKDDVRVTTVEVPALEKGKRRTLSKVVTWPGTITSRKLLLACIGKNCRAGAKLESKAAPALPTATTTLDAARTATGILSEPGGTLTAIDSGGTRYALAVPPNALMGQVLLSLTPVTALTPAQGTLVAGVRIEPAGLLVRGATLEITPPTPLAANVDAFAFAGTSGPVHGLPLLLRPKAMIPVDLFGGYGLRIGEAKAASVRASGAGPAVCRDAGSGRAAGATADATAVGCLPGDIDKFLDELTREARKKLAEARKKSLSGDKEGTEVAEVGASTVSLVDDVVGPEMVRAGNSQVVTANTLEQLLTLAQAAGGALRQADLAGGKTGYRYADLGPLFQKALRIATGRCATNQAGSSFTVKSLLSNAYMIGGLIRSVHFTSGEDTDVEDAFAAAAACMKKVSFKLDVETIATEFARSQYRMRVATQTNGVLMQPQGFAGHPPLPSATLWMGSAEMVYTDKTITKEPGSYAKSISMKSATGAISAEAFVNVVNKLSCPPGGKPVIESDIKLVLRGAGTRSKGPLVRDQEMFEQTYPSGDGGGTYTVPGNATVLLLGWMSQYPKGPDGALVDNGFIFEHAETDGAVQRSLGTFEAGNNLTDTWDVTMTLHPQVD